MSLVTIDNDLQVIGNISAANFPTNLVPFSTSFNQIRVSRSRIFYNRVFQNSNGITDDWDSAGTATITFDNWRSTMNIVATTTYVFQTRRYWPCPMGYGQRWFMSAQLTGLSGTSVVRLGVFDNQANKTVSGNDPKDRGGDGFFWQYSSNDWSVVIRRSTNASPWQADEVIARANWNVDRFDGNGPSGYTLTPGEMTMYFVDRTANCTIGFGVISPTNNRMIYCHLTSVVNNPPKRSSLPIRLEVTQATVALLGTNLVLNECEPYGNKSIWGISSYEAGGSGQTAGNTAFVPVLSVRAKATSIRCAFTVIRYKLAGSGNTFAMMRLFRRATLTGASWISVDANSQLEYDRSATAMSGGILIEGGASGYANAFRPPIDNLESLECKIYCAANIAGEPEIMTIAAATGSGSMGFYADMLMRELE